MWGFFLKWSYEKVKKTDWLPFSLPVDKISFLFWSWCVVSDVTNMPGDMEQEKSSRSYDWSDCIQKSKNFLKRFWIRHIVVLFFFLFFFFPELTMEVVSGVRLLTSLSSLLRVALAHYPSASWQGSGRNKRPVTMWGCVLFHIFLAQSVFVKLSADLTMLERFLDGRKTYQITPQKDVKISMFTLVL